MKGNRSMALPGTALLRWARPRRWSILVEAVLAAAVALAAWPIIAVGNDETEAVEIVTAYLEALREGDVERAETFVSDSYDMAGADQSWLTAEAMSSNWEIESVELKSASESTVHAVISSGGTRTEGAFTLEGAEGDWEISNPYLYLSSSSPLFSTLEIGGVRGEFTTVEGATATVALYPGVYSLFASAPDLAGEDGLSLVALPGSDVYGYNSIDLGAFMTEPLSGSDAVEARLNEALATWLDGCAESTELAPAGCPFSAAYDYGIAYDGINEFGTVTELDWAVGAYPKVRFDRYLRLDVVDPGWMALSGKGTVTYEGDEAALDGRCDVAFDYIAPVIGEDGTIDFTLTAATRNTCF
jgi:hypothetical protein